MNVCDEKQIAAQTRVNNLVRPDLCLASSVDRD
eukprot:COSAG01_NODE_51705_length_352_cov_2.644269_1_plen_32_part_10